MKTKVLSPSRVITLLNSIQSSILMLKDLINAIPTLRGLNSCQDQHSCRADPRADLRSLHSGQPDTLVDT